MSWLPLQGHWRRRTEGWRERMRTLARGAGQRRRPGVFSAAGDLGFDQSRGFPGWNTNTDVPTRRSTWDEAFARVESYLSAHHLESRELLNRRTQEVMTEARRLTEANPGEDPVQLAMQVLHARLGTWFMRAFGEGDWADERFRARGRLALLMTGLPNDAPHCFLGHEPLESEQVEALKAARLQSGPELRLSNMPPAPLDLGDENDAPAWRKGRRWPVAGAIAVVVLALALLGAVTWAAELF